MTPPSTTSRPPYQGSSYSSSTRATNTATLTPPVQRSNSRNTVPQDSHQKNPSVTSNPIQDFEHRPTQEQSQEPLQLYGNLPQLHATEPTYMIGQHSLDHDFGPDSLPNFSFNESMTPEYSDNHISEHTTPQELIWEQQFLSQDSDYPHIYQQNDFGSPQNPQSPSNDFKDIFSTLEQEPPKYVSGSQLLSPQLTSPSPPAARQDFTDSPPEMSSLSKKRAAEPLQVSTNYSALAPHAAGGSPSQKPVSPSVVITSYMRGDSPRPTATRVRSSSKRNRESGLHHTYDDEHSSVPSPCLSPVEISASRLMPPNPYEPAADQNIERSGIDPGQRGTEQVATINELADQRTLDYKNAEVEDWLSKSETGSAADESEISSRQRGRPDRPRAHSTGIRVDAMGLPVYSDRNVPGPGVLIDQDSQDDYSEDGSASFTGSEEFSAVPESPPVSAEKLNESENNASHFPSFEDGSVPPDQEEPLPKQFLRRTPWQDPIQGPITDDTRDQPFSSNFAAMRFNQEAAKWESASRAATWGTRRRLSESEVSAIVDGSRVRHLSLAKRGRQRGNTLLNKARGLIPRRSNSNIKKSSESPPRDGTPELEVPSRKDTGITIKTPSRMASFGKSKAPKSPPLDTSGAFMAMTGNLTAVGHGTSSAIEQSFQKPEGLRTPLQMLRKVRSKSDVGKSPSKTSPGLAEMFTQNGGPPMPTLASPAQMPRQNIIGRSVRGDVDDEDEDDMADDVGVKMDFKIGVENIIPNYEGFKIHARQLNPRLEPYLIDRIGQEQVRRYKKLIDNKIKHTKAVQVAHKCPSGTHCFSLGGEATLLPPRVSARDPDSTYTQFQITNPADEEFDEAGFEEGIVTPALFPAGIPLPPVKRLPAEFECILCFKVKKFQKPSDWTKHVHEDIQPFSCTFPNCNEPKSFKRKADWVRHENERHRRLEYWKCNVSECSHICYRKDNFVQHLVREHKKSEPTAKTRGSGSSKNKPPGGNGWQSEDNEVWRLVDVCRHETSSKPRDEPCRFCGNVCNSWKKLSVHMGKHMEQIAMPVLELIELKEVAPDTVISPIEQNYQQSTGMTGATTVPVARHLDHQSSLSPYTVSAHSYQNSSAGHSPAVMTSQMRYGYDSGYYGTPGISTPTQGPMMQSEAYGNGQMYSTNTAYAASGMPASNQFGSINTQLGSPYPAHAMPTSSPGNTLHASIPRSQPMSNGFNGNVTAASGYHPQHVVYTSSPEMSPFHPYASAAHTGGFSEDSNQQYTGRPQHGADDYMYNMQHVGNNGSNFQYS